MRIVQLGTKYFPAHGGVEVTLRQECEWLARQGHEVQVMCSDLAEHLRGVKLKNGSPNVNGIRVRRCWSFSLPKITYPVMPALPVRLWRSRAEIVHAHAFWYFPADTAARVCKRRKIPFVFNPHFSPRPSAFWARYQRTIGARTLEAADVVVAVSEWEKRLILQEGFKPKRLEVISSGVDPDEFKGVRHNVFERYGVASRPIVLFVARIAPDKGLDLLFQAAVEVLRRQPDAVFFVAGYDFGYWSQLEGLAEKLGIRDSVLYAGSLERADLLSAFQHATVFVLPSQYEAFGLVLAEAMFAGVPVVATRTSAVPLVVEEGKTGLLFTPGAVDELARHLTTLLENEAMRRAMGAAGRERVLERFNVQEHYRRLESIYRSLT